MLGPRNLLACPLHTMTGIEICTYRRTVKGARGESARIDERRSGYKCWRFYFSILPVKCVVGMCFANGGNLRPKRGPHGILIFFLAPLCPVDVSTTSKYIVMAGYIVVVAAAHTHTHTQRREIMTRAICTEPLF